MEPRNLLLVFTHESYSYIIQSHEHACDRMCIKIEEERERESERAGGRASEGGREIDTHAH